MPNVPSPRDAFLLRLPTPTNDRSLTPAFGSIRLSTLSFLMPIAFSLFRVSFLDLPGEHSLIWTGYPPSIFRPFLGACECSNRHKTLQTILYHCYLHLFPRTHVQTSYAFPLLAEHEK